MTRLITLICAISMAVPALYANDDVQALKNYIQTLEQRLDSLEAQTGVIQERQITMEDETLSYLESFAQLKELSDRVELSGNVDMVFAITDTQTNLQTASGPTDEQTTEIYTDQVYIGFSIDVTDKVQGYIGLQFEDYDANSYAGSPDADSDTEDNDVLQVYEAIITVALNDNMHLDVGKQHFGFINDSEYGNFINDSLTRQMGEIRDTGITLGHAGDGFDASVFVFNGAGNEDNGDNNIDTIGGHISFSMEEENMSWSIGAGYISNTDDSDDRTDEIAAYNLHGSFATGSLSVIAEYVSASDEVNVAGDEPSAFSLEAAYGMPLGDRDWTLSAKYEESDEDGDLAEEVLGLGVSTELHENTQLSINWENQETGDDETDLIAAELSISF
jgi:hypothetical protein